VRHSDVCLEWFHFTCLRLDPNNSISKYLCHECLRLQKRDEVVNSSIVDWNKLKDKMNTADSLGKEISHFLSQFIEVLCPVIDGLANSKQLAATDRVKFSELLDTLDFFSSDYFDSTAVYADCKKSLLELLGLQELSDDYRKRIDNSVRDVQLWVTAFKRTSKALFNGVNLIFDELSNIKFCPFFPISLKVQKSFISWNISYETLKNAVDDLSVIPDEYDIIQQLDWIFNWLKNCFQV